MDTGPAILSFSPAPDMGHVRGRPAQAGGHHSASRPLLLSLDLDEGALRALDVFAGWEVVMVASRELTAGLLARWMPAAVAMPLWSPRADAMQLLQDLSALGYAGPVEVLAPALPDRDMVLRELTLAAPGLRLRLTEQPGTA